MTSPLSRVTRPKYLWSGSKRSRQMTITCSLLRPPSPHWGSFQCHQIGLSLIHVCVKSQFSNLSGHSFQVLLIRTILKGFFLWQIINSRFRHKTILLQFLDKDNPIWGSRPPLLQDLKMKVTYQNQFPQEPGPGSDSAVWAGLHQEWRGKAAPHHQGEWRKNLNKILNQIRNLTRGTSRPNKGQGNQEILTRRIISPSLE